MKKRLFASVMMVIISACISSTTLFATKPIPGGGGPGGGSGSGSTSYIVDYEVISRVLAVNGYSTSYVANFVSASAISPNGTCQVIRDHYSTVKIIINTEDTGTIYYDLFMKFNISGEIIELRVVNSVNGNQ